MSLLTRCPACTTIYKVVPDQMRISQGWVKCGQCGDIFDANQHLVHLEPQQLPQQTVQDELADGEAISVQEQVRVNEQSDVVETVQPQQLGDNASLTDQVLEHEQQQGQKCEQEREQEQEQEQEERQAPDSDTQHLIRSQDVPRESDGAEQSRQAISGNAQEVSFMRSYRRSQFWHKTWVRGGLVAMMIVLVVSLMAQWVYQERQFLAAAKSEWRPALRAFCDVLGCQVEALRQIQALSIDAAAFNKIDDTHYRLSFALKNAASLPLAVPSIELTLTDLQDQVVLRRVFSAKELDSVINLLSPTSQWQVSVSLRLETNAVTQRVVGYKVLAFYP